MISVSCHVCSKEFLRRPYEFKRNQKLGRKQFCSKSCLGNSSDNLQRIKLESSETAQRAIREFSGNRRDEFTGFRALLKGARSRARASNGKIEFAISLEDLIEQWMTQNGRCVYSKVSLELPRTRTKHNKIWTASLDRTDASKGYVKGNVQFVSIAVNYAKNNMTHQEMVELCSILRNTGLEGQP